MPGRSFLAAAGVADGSVPADGNGVDRAAVGGVPDAGELGLFRLGGDGGVFSDDAEHAGDRVGAHAAADAAGGIDGDGHGSVLLAELPPLYGQLT